MAPRTVRNSLVLELHIPHFDTARAFYALFGFKELRYDPVSGGGSDLGYMVLTREDTIGRTLINFYGDGEKVAEHRHFAGFPADTPRGYAVEITVPVSDVEGLWEEVEGKLDPGIISQPLTLKRWGKRDFRVVDPFGFYLRFTELFDLGQ